ncbi:MAG TPA: putative PEP-binding protein [Candidatus Dormibacteraeota bacterium]
MGEVALRGVSAAPGIRSGPAVVLDRHATTSNVTIAPEQRAAELDRATRALKATEAELESIVATMRGLGRDEEAGIVETGILMAGDPGLIQRVEELVIESGRPAAEALRDATGEIASELARLPDQRLAERADDVRSLGRRAAAHALGATTSVAGGVVVADSLGPADVADLGLGASGVALAGGGVTAHAAIVARSLGIPMVVGLGPGVLDMQDGEEVVLDGDSGILVRRPDAERVAAANADAERRRIAREAARARRLTPAQTVDGRRIVVLGNAASIAEAIEGSEQGAEGVGLLRTELTFLDATGWPSLAQQKTFLAPIFDRLSGQTATVRLFDFGGDKTPPFLQGAKDRGIDLLLKAPEALRDQLAAIIDAGAKTRLRILVPMVTKPEQLQAVRQALASVLDGRPAPAVGAMIETPDAARRPGEIAKESDFFSIGTNDLTQLVLGLDREQSKSAPVTDRRVLRLIDSTVRAAHAAGIVVDVCGEAASDVVAMPILVGLGVDELSVAAARVGEVRESIRRLEFAACREASERLLVDEAADAAGKSR